MSPSNEFGAKKGGQPFADSGFVGQALIQIVTGWSLN